MDNKCSLLLNYSDVFFSFHFKDEELCTHVVSDHTLVYIYFGELLAEDGINKTIFKEGESFFLRKNHRISLSRELCESKKFCAVFLVFNRKFLREFYQQVDKSFLPDKNSTFDISFIKLPITPGVTSLFQSMIPYFDSSTEPTVEFIKLKLIESVYALLNTDKRLAIPLFDFIEPWKIDILDFMNENYMYELSLEEIASYTGRSLATFKRDFKKISSVSPQKWIINKRLDEAHRLLSQEGKAVSDIYHKLGFKSLSHFSQAYKKQYGKAPTK